MAAPAQVSQGWILAKQGQFKEALYFFQQAQKLDPQIDLNPKTKIIDKEPSVVAGKLAAPVKVKQGERLVKEGKVAEAIAALQQAQKLDPNLKISAYSWNRLCRFGSLHKHAAEVMFACEKAVTLAPENGGIRDSRGLARALTGNTKGAIEDFQAYIESEWYYNRIAQRQRWIDALRANKNPFTDEEIKSLFNEWFY
ncbi:MAG: tetratricopeptide repeat protein [Prochloraceae cyanobacterium]|nr:tetratricopeptide repeat protein [Prochloraceae cyanobacterium]